MVQKKLPTINSAHGSETRNIINELIKLFNGMGYTYDEALRKAHDVLSEAERTNKLNNNTNQRLDNIIADSGTSSTEVVDSRGDFTVLGGRMEYVQKGVEEEFQKRNISKTPNTNLHSFKEKRVLNTFIDDDGSTEVMNKLKPLSEQYNIPFVIALIGNRIEKGTGISVEQALSLQNDLGWEIASHEYDHIALDEVTDPEKVLYEIKYSQEYLRSFGMDVQNIVYPFGRINKEIIDLSARFYNCGVSTSNGTNTPPVRTFALKRIAFPHNSANNSLQWYKNIVDTAKENNEWIIWMLHCGTAEHDAVNQQILSDLIAYIQSQEIETVTLQDGLEIYGNAVSINDEQYYIGADGKNNMINYEVLNTNQITGIEEITPQMKPNEFEKSKTFVNHINTAASREGTPNNKSGALTTILTAVSQFSYQTFMTDDRFYVRYSNASGTDWGDWIEYSVKKKDVEMELKKISIPASSTLEPTFYNSEISVSDINILIPLSNIPTALTWNYYSTGNGAIKIRFYNSSSAKIDLPETNWRLIRSR